MSNVEGSATSGGDTQTTLPTEQPQPRRSPKLPTFWQSDPKRWFAIAESQFTISGITSSKLKYHHVVANMSEEVAMKVKEYICETYEPGLYDTLRMALIDCFSETTAARLSNFDRTTIDDDLPSDLLRKLRHLAEKIYTEDVVIQKWLSKLPASVRASAALSRPPSNSIAGNDMIPGLGK